jgi:hypothetical protein
MIRGQKVDILKNPVSFTDLKDRERFVPVQISTRNIRSTDAGNTIRRPGYEEKFDVNSTSPVLGLVPEKSGYAITTSGKVHHLTSPVVTLTGTITATTRPQWQKFADDLIIVSGGTPYVIGETAVSNLTGAPSGAYKFIGSISSYVLLCGHDDTEVKYSVPGNQNDWVSTGSGFFNTKNDGEKILFFTVLKENAIFFKETKIEVWGLSSLSTAAFSRRDGSWVDKGLGAKDSVVKANGTLYWFGDDGDFYVLSGNNAQVISKPIRRELNKLSQRDKIYGFDFRKENVIRWFAPHEGKCFTYDYYKNTWHEDARWQNGQWARLPINSYMELEKRAYIGDYEPTGKVYEWSEEFFDDDGDEIRAYRNFRVKGSARGNRARFNQLLFRVKKGHAASGNLSTRWNPDEKGWSNVIPNDIGALGNHDPYIHLSINDIAREMEFEVIETKAIDFLLTEGILTLRELNG